MTEQNKIKVLKVDPTDLTTGVASLLNATGVLKLNSKGRFVFKHPSKKLLESGAITEYFRSYNIRQVNKVMSETNPIFIDPATASISEIYSMVNNALLRNYIPTFYGRVEGGLSDEDRYDIRNFKTLSFGIFTGSNPDRTTSDYIFAYFSQSEEEHELEAELEGYRPEFGNSVHIVDTLNDMFGITAGVDYTLFQTVHIDKNPKLKAIFKSLYEGQHDSIVETKKLKDVK